MTLDQAIQGELYKIHSYQSNQAYHLRMMEMGLIPGEIIEIYNEAPLTQDPMIVKVRGTLIALRKEQAKNIKVVEIK